MGATTSKEPQPGGSESRGGVTLVNTNNSTAESEVDKYDATSTNTDEAICEGMAERDRRGEAGLGRTMYLKTR